jgi:hypothetical protein
MATFFSLQDGNLSNSSVYGYSLSSAEVMSNTTGVWLSTVDAYGPTFTGDGSSISAVAVHLSARSADPNNSVLTLKLSSASSVRTETYPVSSFTSYNGSNNLLTNYPQNWQIIKLSSPYTLPRLSACKISLATSSLSTLSLMCGASNNYNKAIISSTVSAVSASLVPLDTNTTGMAFVSGITLTKSGTISGSTDSPFTDTTGLSASYYTNSGTLTIPYATNTVSLNTTFTMEFWVKPLNSSFSFLRSFGTTGTVIYYDGSMKIAQFASVNCTRTINSSTLNLNQWNHVAFCQLNGVMYFYVNGVLKTYSDSSVYWASAWVYGPLDSNNPLTICSNGFVGYFTGIRFIQGYCLYTGNRITVPTTRPLPILNTQAYIIEPNSGKYYFNTNVTDTINLHLGSSLVSSGVESRNITANSHVMVDNLFIHNNANLNFNASNSPLLLVKGASGIQITSDGTLNVGTSSSPVLSSTTHTIVLSNTQIDVHNGGNLNVYGYSKPVTTNLISDINATVRTFSATDSLSGSWSIGDVLLFKPNLSNRLSFDVLTLSSFYDSNIFTSTANSSYSHTGSATYGIVPAIYNLTRNVKINGYDGTNRGTIRTIDASKTNINYTELNNFGISAINSKNGLFIGNNLSGYVTLSGSVINSDNIPNIGSIVPSTGKIFQNINISNNIIKNNSLILSSLSVNNVNILNNYILSSFKMGLQMNNLSGSINMLNNTTIGSLSYGTYIYNNTLSGSYGALNYSNGLQGMIISGTNTGIFNINGGGIYSVNEGVYIDSTTSNLSTVTFQNIIASNNSSVGFKVSGNNLNYLTPTTVNINGLTASNNSSFGFEGYNIIGSFSSVVANYNTTNGIRTSIGDGDTIFDGLTSLVNGTALIILSGYNYNKTNIKNALLSSSLPSTGAGLSIDSTRFSQFVLDNTILSAAIPFQMNTTRNLLEGSYLFNNCSMGATPLGTGIASKYQSANPRSTGFAFTNLNKTLGLTTTYLTYGERAMDNSIAKTGVQLPSERLTPYSINRKLKSGSKFVALDGNDYTTVSVLVRKSVGTGGETAYNGNNPRLILKRNPSMGINSDITLNELSNLNDVSGAFVSLSAETPVVNNTGLLEFYVDCDGSQGWINVDDWYAI